MSMKRAGSARAARYNWNVRFRERTPFATEPATDRPVQDVRRKRAAQEIGP
ncbi:hypothetical protein MPOCJGCO_0392 [Methylobacterium trifolii]|uniref:Uncharacterized protein n=1 Tax=Methylobacterium trifolii TaxID=1003092 RepID=A0ABQ4TWF0_9HYPH|nr:hypothetical protein MPOCJGCO_0392 [Methylobacterium trifolii]